MTCRPVNAPGIHELLELRPCAKEAAVANPTNDEVRVLVERLFVDDDPSRPQATRDVIAVAEDAGPEPVDIAVRKFDCVALIRGQHQSA